MESLDHGILFYLSGKKLPYIDRAQGIYMWDKTGKEYIDGCSGAMVSNIGHCDPRVLEAIKVQAETAFFAYRLHFESEAAVRLAMKLVDLTAPHLERVFYVSGGSEAVESAMKLCREYHVANGEGQRHIFISRTPSYHGSTLGALALTSYSPLEIPYRPMIKAYPKVPAPYCYRCAFNRTPETCQLDCAHALEKIIVDQGPENVAGFVVEPVVGASIGALPSPEGYFDLVQDICTRYGVMLILDEVMTGFGRTGRFFGYEHWDVHADIIAMSKGIASGYYPLGAVMATREIVDTVLAKNGFAHGHTYSGNPMACAVGLAVVNIIEGDRLPENAAMIGEVLREKLDALAEKHPMIGQVRGLGLLQAMEIVKDRKTREPYPAELNASRLLTDIAYDEGLIIYQRRSINGLSGDHVIIAPPLILTADQAEEVARRLDKALTRTAEALG